VGNKRISGNSSLVSGAVALLSARLPPGWSAKGSTTSEGDVALRVRAPGSATEVLVVARRRVEPKDVGFLASEFTPAPNRPVLVAAPFLSPRTRELLKGRGFGYTDLTGNIRLTLSDPALFMEAPGADENPSPPARERRSLKGAKAGRLVRALCDFRPPVGLRELAKRAGVDAGYASRIVELLVREALLTRDPRGPIRTIDWPALLRRWSNEYSPFQRDRVSWFLAARGVNSLIERLRTVRTRYVVSGSWAAAQYAPVVPPRLVLCYAESARDLATELDLRPTESGANVALAVPFDSVVFERTVDKKGVSTVALTQVAADLLTSPGRGPNEAEALIEWMRGNEDAWRS
jgi:hypothetical protein